MSKNKIVTQLRGVFSLPWYVAREEGLFEAEGVDVVFTEDESQQQQASRVASLKPEFIDDHRFVSAFWDKSKAVEQKRTDVYNACEWGQVRRSQDHQKKARIISKRTSVVSQALFSAPGSRFTHPQTLRNQKVAVRFHAGSHYLALQLLEGFLKRDEIKLISGSHIDAYEAVRRGEIAAVALMEPWITVAEKEGFQNIGEAFYQGSEIASPDVDPETWEAVNRAVAKGVKIFNANKRKYVHHLIDRLPPQYAKLITPEDFHLPRLRYVAPQPYDLEEFQGTYDWLVGWGLIAPNSCFEDLVDNRIEAPVEAKVEAEALAV